MANVAVIGTQWGDEGKGKIVDWLSERADIVVRFQGGHNAGHTLVIDRKEYKLSILPSGIVRTGKLSIIGNGTVVDPFHLLSEIKYLQDQGINISSKNLLLSETATLILPIHAKVDKARELLRGSSKIGTTGRGIGPAYEDKIARRALRIGDLSDYGILEEKIEQIVSWHNIFLKEVGEDEVSVRSIIEQLMPIIPEILSFSGRSWEALAHAHINGKRILFEGAQGVMLDIDHGTYPFVTSSNTSSGNAAIGSGIGPKNLDKIVGVTKAYISRVGSGPFITEQKNEIGDYLIEKGAEFGVVTGRRRRCGWLDLISLKYSARVNSLTELFITKLDVLSGLEELKLCVGYKNNGEVITDYPYDQNILNSAEPVYEIFDGWMDDISTVKSFEDLPDNAKSYIKAIQTFVDVPITFISVGPERTENIII